MKNITLVMLIVFTFSMPGCSWLKSSTEQTAQIKQVTEIGPADKLSESNMVFFTDNDTYYTAIASSPYYMGKKESIQPEFRKFDEVRKQKVAQAQKDTVTIFETAKSYKNKLDEYKVAYTDFIEKVLKDGGNEAELSRVAEMVVPQIVSFDVKENAFLAAYSAVNAAASEDSSANVSSYFEYQKTLIALNLAYTLLQDTATFLTSSASLVLALEHENNPVYKNSLEQFNKKMLGFSEINSQLNSMRKTYSQIGAILSNMETADYYVGMAAVGNINKNLEKINEKLLSANPTKTLIADDLKFLQDYSSAMGKFTDKLQNNLEKTRKDSSIPDLSFQEDSLLPVANAADKLAKIDSPKYLNKAYEVISSRTTVTGATPSSKDATLGQTVDAGWTVIKSGFTTGQLVVGGVVDITGAYIESGIDLISGQWKGEDFHDINNKIENNFKKVQDNFDNDISGSEIYKRAGEYLSNIDNAVGDFADAKMGPGYTSSSLGLVAKLTSGLVTGFGEGVYKLVDPNSSGKDLAEGTLNVGLSLIGGSKVILKEKGLVSGSVEIVKDLSGRGLSFVERMKVYTDVGEYKAIANELKNIFPDMKGLMYDMKNELAEKLAAGKSWVVGIKDFDKWIIDFLKKGGEKYYGLGKGEYKGFVKDAYEKSLVGYLEALKAVFGKNPTEFLENLAGAKIDEYLTKVTLNFTGFKVEGEYEGAASNVNKDLETCGSYMFKVLVNESTVTGTATGKGAITCSLTLKGTMDNNGKIKGSASGIDILAGGGAKFEWYYIGDFSGTLDKNMGNIDVTLKPAGYLCPKNIPCVESGKKLSAPLKKL